MRITGKPVTRNSIVTLGLIAFVLNLFLYFSLSINLFFGLVVLLLLFFGTLKTPNLFFSFFIQSVFFQNTFIAFFSGFVASESHFKILHGINFLLPGILTVLIFKNNSDYFDKNFFRKSVFVVMLLSVYFIYGALGYGFLNSAQYARLFLVPILFFLSGLYFSRRSHINFYDRSLKHLFLICVLVTALQLLFPYAVSYALNDLQYFSLKWGVDGWEDLLSRYKSKRLFNISWFDIKLNRIGSLIKSIISLGYFLTILAIYYYMPQKKVKLCSIVLLAVLAVNSKGALLVFLFASLLYFLSYRSNLSKRMAFALYFLTNIVFIIFGYMSRNEHIVGFTSGAGYLPTLGNGLGFGGNLSDMLVTEYNGEPLPDLGYWTRFQNGSESVYGVLFASLGVFSVFYIYYFVEITVMLFRKLKYTTVRANVLKVLTVVLLFQGIYQEEAFSPYAFGLVMFLVGLNFKKDYEEKTI